MLLIDTSVLIEYFRKVKKEDSFFYQLAASHKAFCISTITKYEILVGSNSQQDDFWQRLFENIPALPFDDNAATEASLIKKELKAKGETIGFEDIAMAATARSCGLALATLNQKHFTKIANLSLVTR